MNVEDTASPPAWGTWAMRVNMLLSWYEVGAREEGSNPDGAWELRKGFLQEEIPELSLQE